MAKKPFEFPQPDAKELTYAERAEVNFMPTGTPSLMESIRANLPSPGEGDPPLLVKLAEEQQSIYLTMLGKLIAGSSMKAACLAVGLSPNRFYHWLQVGAADLADDVDTFCSRLLLDCQRAQAMSVSDAEERVHKTNPSVWLGKGSAKEFHRREYWVDQPLIAKGQEPDEIPAEVSLDPLDPPPVRYIESEGEEQVEGDGNEAIDFSLTEALKILEDHRIVNDPEFVKQAKEQFGMKETDGKDN